MGTSFRWSRAQLTTARGRFSSRSFEHTLRREPPATWARGSSRASSWPSVSSAYSSSSGEPSTRMQSPSRELRPGGHNESARLDTGAPAHGPDRPLRHRTPGNRRDRRRPVHGSDHHLRRGLVTHRQLPQWRLAKPTLVTGVLLEMCSAVAIVVIRLLMYRVSRRVDPRWALGYPIMPVTEFTVSALLAAYLLTRLTEFPNHLLWVYLPTGIGGLILNYMFLISGLVPRGIRGVGTGGICPADGDGASGPPRRHRRQRRSGTPHARARWHVRVIGSADPAVRGGLSHAIRAREGSRHERGGEATTAHAAMSALVSPGCPRPERSPRGVNRRPRSHGWEPRSGVT